jgi:HTH-type transcriptional regulator / antitoxin HigA
MQQSLRSSEGERLVEARLKPIRTDADHDAAVARIGALWGAATESVEGEELEALAVLVDAYERQRWPLPTLDPVETLLAHMELNGLVQADLARVLGSASRASEILNRKRALNLPMIRALHAAWGIPVAMLVAEYELAA